MMTRKTIIQVKNLTAQFGEKVILHDINFDIYAGEVFVILGCSGSGKTTLMNHVIGLLEPTTGNVIIDGDDIATADEETRQNILHKIGVMYQSGALFGSMSLLENVRLPLEEFTRLPFSAMNVIARNKLQMVGLGDFIDYMPAEVSGGMAKRAAIARAMVLDPQILFLDEPSAGLDPIISAQIDNLILNLARTLGITFVVVSHELPSIYAIADRSIMLYGGKIIAEGKPSELREKSANMFVRKFFNREA